MKTVPLVMKIISYITPLTDYLNAEMDLIGVGIIHKQHISILRIKSVIVRILYRLINSLKVVQKVVGIALRMILVKVALKGTI